MAPVSVYFTGFQEGLLRLQNLMILVGRQLRQKDVSLFVTTPFIHLYLLWPSATQDGNSFGPFVPPTGFQEDRLRL